MGEPGAEDYDVLLREVIWLRQRVTELQRAAARHEDTDTVSLAEREELLRDAERVAHLGTWTWDVASGRVTWSDELYRILGREPESLTPSVETFMSMVHPDDRASAQAAAEQSAREGFLSPNDCRVVRPNGAIRHIRSSTVMLFDKAGVVRRIVGGVLDRTESLEVEARLRRALALLEEAQRFAQLGSWRYVPATKELEWSLEFRRIAGLPADVAPDPELFIARVLPEDRPLFRANQGAESREVLGDGIEARLQRPDGQIRHVRLSGFTFTTVDGTQEMRGTMLDVTDQVRVREELAHAQKMEAVGRLAAGIAHDFNNLLTVFVANLELLGSRIGSAPEIDDSLQALSSATALTRRLLTFGRKAQLTLKQVAPNTLVRSLGELMRRLVGDEVRIEVDLAADLPVVHIDPIEMERALVNLVVNARDAMPNGGVVYIATRASTHRGAAYVEFSVGDEGPGISEDVRPHLFEPFFTTRAAAGGTGLGLATVLGTAEQHGGTVRVDARAGGGTVFTIALPAATEGNGQKASLDVGRHQRLLRPLQLMVIDDEARITELMKRMLELHGHTVWAATEPDQALRLWAERGARMDLVICDVAMARVRGPALVEKLAEHGPRPRVLFITGYSEELLRDPKPGQSVLSKPFTSAELLAAIARAFEPGAA